MRRRSAVWTAVLVLALLLAGKVVLATPTPPYLLVNHSTRQCTESILGDDCSWCEPPQGWDVVGYAAGNQCPQGYAWVERVDLLCRGYKNPFCCTSGSHHGDCDDMIVHDGDRVCAFVDDIDGCALPDGWEARPPDADPAAWSCPVNYAWADPVACVSPEATTPPLRAGTAAAVGCLLFLFLAVAAAGLVLALVVARRRRR